MNSEVQHVSLLVSHSMESPKSEVLCETRNSLRQVHQGETISDSRAHVCSKL